MPLTQVTVTATIDPALEALVDTGLGNFNEAAAGYGDTMPLAVTLADAQTGKPLGGAVGRSSLGLLFLDLFYLPESLRGHGLGSRVLREFEAEGRRRGCRSAVLFTISFQAPEFYKRHGWSVFGEIPCDPPGTSRIFLTKLL